ncbi:MAG: glucose-1-phosphate thymidylyltransferase [Leptospira sp.]|nr:glucose-1-phosphate thymidylyltransferase [Leptospira sp.]NCS92280.1 glucose-1-phosphate thymidylyltransferase [Leptospira sp.]
MPNQKIKRILIHEENGIPGIEVLTKFKSFSELRIGYFNSIQKLKKLYPSAKLYYKNSDSVFYQFFLNKNPTMLPDDGKDYDFELKSSNFQPWDLIQNIPRFIDEDISLSKDISKWKNKFKSKSSNFELVGKDKYLFIHPDAKIYPGVVFDTTSGPIVIDQNVKITPFSFLEGPLYIGADSQIDNAKIGGGSIIGRNCRIGGEVENTIIQDYSNKHHEGFLGHSFLGSWVNMGALSTTSDLKNNYGMIEITSESGKIPTGTIKFGSLIGDFSKIGIGVMLNTGTVVDPGCNLVSNRITGYKKSFTWIEDEQNYRLDRFLQDTKKIMARRSIDLSMEEEALITSIYNRCIK